MQRNVYRAIVIAWGIKILKRKYTRTTGSGSTNRDNHANRNAKISGERPQHREPQLIMPIK